MRTRRKNCKKQRKKRILNKKYIKNVTKICAIIAAMSVFISTLFSIARDWLEVREKLNPSYDYDMNMEWLDMEEAFNALTEKSEVSIFSSSPIPDYRNPKDIYHLNGVTLIALFSNKANVERNIVKFSIYVEDIVENHSPDIECIMVEDDSNPIMAHFSNNGWGDTGEIHLSIEDIMYYDSTIADISILEGKQNNWIFDSIPSGETHILSLADVNIFNVVWKDYSIDSTYFSILVNIYAPETGYTTSCTITMEATPSGVRAREMGGQGGGDEVNYVIVVDTGLNNWSSTYNIYQRIPANQTVRLPIFVLPTRSCTMSVRVEFDLEDGETITADPLHHTSIKVPYYTELKNYISGEDLDWNALEGSAVIWFPYEMNSKVLPKME